MEKTRIEWIDIAKGIGILLVIAGHTFYLGYSYPLYAFHMPLFFFLSGLLFKEKGECFGIYLKSKSNSLLRPWLIMLFISFMVCLFIPQWRNQITIHAVASDLYTANTNVFQNSSLWYLVCFYFVLLIFYFTKMISKVYSLVILIIVAIASLWLKELLQLTDLPFHRLPFKIDSAIIALVFFSVAFYYKKGINNFMRGKGNVLLAIVIIIASAALCVYNRWSNINSLDFGKIKLLYYPNAFLGIASVCLISKVLLSWQWKPLNAILAFYGKNSLLIFGFQSLFIRLYLLIFNNTSGLNMQLYGNNPMVHQVGAFFVVAFIISPVVVFSFQYLRKHNIKVL